MTSPPPADALHALERMLLSMFSASEMRRLVRYLPGGDALVAQLPDRGISPMALSEQVVVVLQRTGALNEVFDAIRRERPRRVDEVDQIQARIAGTASAPVPDPITARRKMDRTAVLDALNRLTPVEFDELLWTLKLDHAVVEERAEHRRRVLQLVRHMDRKDRLDELQTAIADLK